jgi:hypothetical protein
VIWRVSFEERAMHGYFEAEFLFAPDLQHARSLSRAADNAHESIRHRQDRLSQHNEGYQDTSGGEERVKRKRVNEARVRAWHWRFSSRDRRWMIIWAVARVVLARQRGQRRRGLQHASIPFIGPCT